LQFEKEYNNESKICMFKVWFAFVFHGKIQKKRQTLNAVDFYPRQPKDKTVNQGSLDKLTQALILANPTCGFVKYNTESGNTDRVRWKF
jgi:hypothetical protein